MNYAIGRGLAIAACATVWAQGAIAQESTNNVAQLTDWSVFTDGDPKECWGVSAPKESTAQREGNPVQVSRSDILLFVTYRTGGTPAEVSFTGGYPFAPGSTVSMTSGPISLICSLMANGHGPHHPMPMPPCWPPCVTAPMPRWWHVRRAAMKRPTASVCAALPQRMMRRKSSASNGAVPGLPGRVI